MFAAFREHVHHTHETGCIIAMKTKTYNPSGLVTKKPIYLRLMPPELSEAESVAVAANISRSNLARQAFLAGLPIVKAALLSPSASAVTSPTQPSEAFSSGEASASSAGLSTLAA